MIKVVKSSKNKKPFNAKQSAIEVSQKNVKRFKANILNPDKLWYDILLLIGIDYYLDGCGRCYGFQCTGCWRGFVVIFAYEDEDFYNYVKRVNDSNRDVILDGVDRYEKSKYI